MLDKDVSQEESSNKRGRINSRLRNLARGVPSLGIAWTCVSRWMRLVSGLLMMDLSAYPCKGVTGSSVFEMSSIGCAVTPPHGPRHVSL